MDTNKNNTQPWDVNGILVEVVNKTFSRKWGWIEAWDVFADVLHVARVLGGHYDLTAKPSANKHYDSDGEIWYSLHSNSDFRLPFRMTDEIRKLILARQPCLLWEITMCGCPQDKGFFATAEEARQHCANKFEQPEERLSTI